MHTTTKNSIIQLADNFTRDKGFNAFSFYDISKSIGIKTASIHYHFPTKTDLGVAVVKMHTEALEVFKKQMEHTSPVEKLEAFFGIYTRVCAEKKVCIVGSLATELHSVEEPIRQELEKTSSSILDWVSDFLAAGKKQKLFRFSVPARTKALMIITNMLAMAQLERLTGTGDSEIVKEAIRQELIIHHPKNKTRTGKLNRKKN